MIWLLFKYGINTFGTYIQPKSKARCTVLELQHSKCDVLLILNILHNFINDISLVFWFDNCLSCWLNKILILLLIDIFILPSFDK